MNLRHELNTPITTLKTIISLLKEDNLINERLLENSKNAFDRIDDILTELEKPKISIHGLWKLEELYCTDGNNKLIENPLGKKLNGYISYNNDGTMSSIISSDSGEVIAYTAFYEVQFSNIEYKIIQSTDQSQINATIYKSFELTEKALKITTFKENSTDNKTITHYLWKRLKKA